MGVINTTLRPLNPMEETRYPLWQVAGWTLPRTIWTGAMIRSQDRSARHNLMTEMSL